MTDRVELVADLAALMRLASQRGDSSAEATLRAAIAAIMESAGAHAKEERRRARDRNRKRNTLTSDGPILQPVGAVSSVGSSISAESVESSESAETVESADSAESPHSLPAGSPEPPPNPTHPHTLTHTREAQLHRTGPQPAPKPAPRGATVSRAHLAEVMGEHMGDVAAYLDAIGARNLDGWHTELLKIVGPATGVLPEDLAQALRDALLVEPIVKQPGPLRTFVAFNMAERRKNGAGANGANGFHSANSTGGANRSDARNKSGPVDDDSAAGAAFAAIRKLITVHKVTGQSPVRFIPKADVQAMGERVFTAYEQIGGADRFLDQSESIGFQLRDFTRAFIAYKPPDQTP